MNPLLQTGRARDERRDQRLPVLEFCLEFVSWKRDRFVAVAAGSSLAKNDLPLSLIANEGFGWRWFTRCNTRN